MNQKRVVPNKNIANNHLNDNPYLNHARRLKTTIKQHYTSLSTSFQQHQKNIEEVLSDMTSMLRKALAKNAKLKKQIKRLRDMLKLEGNTNVNANANSSNEELSLSFEAEFKIKNDYQKQDKTVHKKKKKKSNGLPKRERQLLQNQYPFMIDFTQNYLCPKLQYDPTFNSSIYKRVFVNIYMRWNQQKRRICHFSNHSLIQMRLTNEIKTAFPQTTSNKRYFQGLKFKSQWAGLEDLTDIITKEKVKINEEDKEILNEDEEDFNFDEYDSQQM